MEVLKQREQRSCSHVPLTIVAPGVVVNGNWQLVEDGDYGLANERDEGLVFDRQKQTQRERPFPSRLDDLVDVSGLGLSQAAVNEVTICTEKMLMKGEAPIHQEMYYNYVDEDLWCSTASGDSIGCLEITRRGLQDAIEATRMDPRWRIEAYRRRLEHAEIADQVINMPDGQMLKFSPTADSVIRGDLDFGIGYSRDEKPIMMRLWKRAGNEFACTYISLNGDNRDGLVAGLATLNQAPPESMGSEDWLRKCWYFPANIDVAGIIVDAYDQSMQEKFDGKWSYGIKRDEASEVSALDLVIRWPDLLDEHMTKMAKAKTAGEREKLRYDYIAVIRDRHRGNLDIDMETAGDMARANNEEFPGYCETIEVQTNAEALQQMGFSREKKFMHCPYCGRRVYGDPCMPPPCPNPGCSSNWPESSGSASEDAASIREIYEISDGRSEFDQKTKTKNQKVSSDKNPAKSPDELEVEQILDRKCRVERGGLFNGIKALVDENTGEVLAVGFRAKELEYLRQDHETIWLKKVA